MPYTVSKDESACSSSEPYAVKGPDGKVFGCHASEEKAKSQQAALYANTDAAVAAAAAEMEYLHLTARGPVVYSQAGPLELPEPEVTYENDGIVLCRIKDVPLMEVGMKFPASTGPVDFGFGHLASAVRAGEDPTVPRARIKLGHTDPRFNDCPCPECGKSVSFNANNPYEFDAMPSFGFVEGTVLDNEGSVVVGDLVDMPYWLAAVLPVAYPSRSIEGWFGYTGINSKSYEFVITALAMLGVVFPGVMSLSDLPQMYGSEIPSFVEVVA